MNGMDQGLIQLKSTAEQTLSNNVKLHFSALNCAAVAEEEETTDVPLYSFE